MTQRKELVIQADDIGLRDSTLKAAVRLASLGVVKNFSWMAVGECTPRFVEHLEIFKAVSLGAHLTLTNEGSKHRFTAFEKSASSLLSKEGTFLPNVESLIFSGEVDEVELECQSQLNYLTSLGLKLSYIDSHMLALGTKRYFESYLKLADSNSLVPLVGFPSAKLKKRLSKFDHYIDENRIIEAQRNKRLVFDSVFMDQESLTYSSVRDSILDFLRSLHSGRHLLILHPSASPDWTRRYFDYLVCQDPLVLKEIKNLGIELTDYRELSLV